MESIAELLENSRAGWLVTSSYTAQIVQCCPIIGNGKGHLRIGHEGPDEGLVVNATPQPLYPRVGDLVPTVQNSGWGRCGWVRKISPPLRDSIPGPSSP